MRRIRTLGNDNKDAMLDLGLVMLLSLLLKDYIRYVFAQSEYIIRCYFSLCFIRFVAFMHILYSHVVQACLAPFVVS